MYVQCIHAVKHNARTGIICTIAFILHTHIQCQTNILYLLSRCLPSILIFFCDIIVSCFFRFSTPVDWRSFSCDRRTSSLWSRSHICWSSAISCRSASMDFCRELIWISSGPSSTPWGKRHVMHIVECERFNKCWSGEQLSWYLKWKLCTSWLLAEVWGPWPLVYNNKHYSLTKPSWTYS